MMLRLPADSTLDDLVMYFLDHPKYVIYWRSFCLKKVKISEWSESMNELLLPISSIGVASYGALGHVPPSTSS